MGIYCYIREAGVTFGFYKPVYDPYGRTSYCDTESINVVILQLFPFLQVTKKLIYTQ